MRVSPSATAVVVGGGIIGAACALFLARSGVSVRVIDASFPGCGVTSAGMGHLVVMDDSEAQLTLTKLSLQLWRELFEELPASVEVMQCGTLWLARDATEMQAVRLKHALYGEHGVACEILDERMIAECEPELAPLAGALLVPGDAVVYPPAAAVAMLGLAARLGATVTPGWRALSVGRGEVRCDIGVIRADFIVNAAGLGADTLSREIELLPRRGHLVITDRYPGAIRHQLVELGYLSSAHVMTAESVAFNLQPRKTGQLLIGSSRELGADDSAINRDVLRRMLRRAIEFVPGLASCSATRAWTGIRPTSSDKLPFIGPSATVESLWIAAGHEGLGITTALASGKLITELITGVEPSIDPTAFRPDRSPARAWA